MKPCYKLPIPGEVIRNDFDPDNPPGWRAAWPDGDPDSWEIAYVHTLDYITAETLDWLNSHGIKVQEQSLLFRGPPKQSVFIHSDGDKTLDHDSWSQMAWGINYVWGSNDHHMLWYEPLNSEVDPAHMKFTSANNPYVRYYEHEVREIHRECLQGLCLVRTDIPHNVNNYDSNNTRWCLSIRPESQHKSWEQIMAVMTAMTS